MSHKFFAKRRRVAAGTMAFIGLALAPGPFLFVCACTCGGGSPPVAVPEAPWVPLVVAAGALAAIVGLGRGRSTASPAGGSSDSNGANRVSLLAKIARRLAAVGLGIVVLSVVAGGVGAAYRLATPEPVLVDTPACDCNAPGSGAAGDVSGTHSGVLGASTTPSTPTAGVGEIALAGVGVVAVGGTIVLVSRSRVRRARVS